MRTRKRTIHIPPLLLALWLALCALTFDVSAAEADTGADDALKALQGESSAVTASSLTIMVGYFGGPYVTKAVYYVDAANGCLLDEEGNSLSEWFQEQTYTYVDSGDGVIVDEASIISLEDFFELVGIDLGSAQYLHFRTGDDKNQSF
ncbi:MAG: hypothetical protein LUB63_06555, partial [Oscillospiraceae bacterium]|nr:hypothetical protein [Oscillospiraceae bacterium]